MLDPGTQIKKPAPPTRQDGLNVLDHRITPGLNENDLREPLPNRAAALGDVLPWAFTASSYRPRLMSTSFVARPIGSTKRLDGAQRSFAEVMSNSKTRIRASCNERDSLSRRLE
jgi:hypothetical protein